MESFTKNENCSIHTSMAFNCCIMSVFCCLLFPGILLCHDFEHSVFTWSSIIPSASLDTPFFRARNTLSRIRVKLVRRKMWSTKGQTNTEEIRISACQEGKNKKKNVVFGFSQWWKDGPPLIYQLLHAIMCHGWPFKTLTFDDPSL